AARRPPGLRGCARPRGRTRRAGARRRTPPSRTRGGSPRRGRGGSRSSGTRSRNGPTPPPSGTGSGRPRRPTGRLRRRQRTSRRTRSRDRRSYGPWTSPPRSRNVLLVAGPARAAGVARPPVLLVRRSAGGPVVRAVGRLVVRCPRGRLGRAALRHGPGVARRRGVRGGRSAVGQQVGQHLAGEPPECPPWTVALQDGDLELRRLDRPGCSPLARAERRDRQP